MPYKLVIGNELIKLDEVDSTNEYLKVYSKENESIIEGLTVITCKQHSGRGQRGNSWVSEIGKNLTFSIFLKPKIEIKNQFALSKIISIAIIDFLNDFGLKNVKIKWPNDIYVANKKIAGILIENSLKDGLVAESIIGIGLNVNQLKFDSKLPNPTSIVNELGIEVELDVVLEKLLKSIDKYYVNYKTSKSYKIDAKYLFNLYGLNLERKYQINGDIIIGKIVGLNDIGMLKVKISNVTKEFDFKELKYIL